MPLVLRRIFIVLAGFLFSATASATYRNHFAVGAGVISEKPFKKSNVEFGVEAEHRIRRWIGIGFVGNYVLSNPNTTIVGAPEFFFHPFKGDWFFNVSPIVEFGSASKTSAGVRVGTRAILPIGIITIAPTVDVDFINGGHRYLFAVGVEFYSHKP